MNSNGTVLIRNAEVNRKARQDIRMVDGRVVEIGSRLPSSREEIDARGAAVIPGLVDHHIHLLALAAEAESLPLDDLINHAGFRDRLCARLAQNPPGTWLRCTGYHESMAGELNACELDKLAPHHAVRVQHQTGSLWILNSIALGLVTSGKEFPACVERDERGRPTGRIWRGDSWLRDQIRPHIPNLVPVGKKLASFGITAVTDASESTNADAVDILGDACRSGVLPQRLTLMSGAAISRPADAALDIGPVKILLDDGGLPDLYTFVQKIFQARSWGRAVAVHCVTAVQFALTVAAFGAAGARSGDRIEHGSVIPADGISRLRDLELTVITQPGFVRERGDRYASDVDRHELADLYRCRSLMDSGVTVAAGSDAPYASPNPWLSIQTATDRRTRTGRVVGSGERISPMAALQLYQGLPAQPGIRQELEVGMVADLCVLSAPLRDVMANPSETSVRATLIGGTVVHVAK